MTDDVSETRIEKVFCNKCKQRTRHFVRALHTVENYDKRSGTGRASLYMIVECCGCEDVAMVRKTHFSEHVDEYEDPSTGERFREELWDEEIYPPVTYRASPPWFDDLPDDTLREISAEIYKSLQTGSHYLATFGSRTLIDRLIVLTVGDKGNFTKGLQALQDAGKLATEERKILDPVVEAGNAAAHRGWAPTRDQIAVMLDTVEGLIHRLLVLPTLAEELKEAVPERGGNAKTSRGKEGKPVLTVLDKIDAAPKELRLVYDELAAKLASFGDDVTVHPQKHYMAFRRSRNFASVQIYNQKKIIKVFLNLDPEYVPMKKAYMRDVRQIGHFGTGDLEVTLKKKSDIDAVERHLLASYMNS